jgi:hypothetical protein
MSPGGRKLGAELGTVDQGADPSATSDAAFSHVSRESYHVGAEIHGADEACKLSAAVHGAESEVHF